MSTATAGLLPGDQVRIAMNPDSEPFWIAAREERLTMACCAECGTFRLPPLPRCPSCRSTEVTWPDLNGRGEVHSFSVVHGYPGNPELVMIAAVINLVDAPGPRLVTNLVDLKPSRAAIGMHVQVVFSPIADGWKLPVFRPVDDVDVQKGAQ